MRRCLTLAERSAGRLGEKLHQYRDRCELIEVRLDFLDAPAVPPPPGGSAELIATCRPVREGGRFKGGERERLQLLSRAAAAGFHWVDLELDAELHAPLPSGTRLIRSHHVFGRFPDPAQAYHALERRGGDCLKLAVEVRETEQLTALLGFMEQLGRGGHPRVVIGMGERAQASRFLGELLGNAWTYVSEDESPVAPGQFPLEAAAQFPAGPPERLYGVLGRPVAHSLSPPLHNVLFTRYGIPGWYLPLELDRLEPWFRFLERTSLPFAGFSVTLPFKTEVLPFLERTDSPVESVNTLRRDGGSWVGSNTDLPAFLGPLRRRLDLSGKEAVVLGAGGVVHTVVRALEQEGAAVTVLARDPAKAARFAARHGCRHGSLAEGVPPADLLVNATPVGQYPEVDECLLHSGQIQAAWVYDLIYHPPRTLLLERAEEAGSRTISGLEMFVEQAALQFQIWTGVCPDRDFMAEYLAGVLSGENTT